MNHLPFVLRSYLEVPWRPSVSRRTHVKMPAMRFGGDDGRMLLQDLCIDPLYTYQDPTTDDTAGLCQLLARMGTEGRGYLTEELLPLAVMHNSSFPHVPVWKFERPYRLDPGQGLRVQIIHRDVTTPFAGSYNKTPAVMFHGKRVKDELPIMLYDAKHTYISQPTDDYGTVVNLSDVTYNCPADSPVLISSVASYTKWRGNELGGTTPAPLIQIFGPDGRPWSTAEVETNNLFLGVAPAVLNNWSVGEWAEGRGWLDPSQNLIQLGEARGWFLQPNENFILELENPNGSSLGYYAYDSGAAFGYNLMVAVTLRGCLEVSDG